MTIYNDLKELFDQIEYLENKIDRLRKLKESKEFKNIQIHFFLMVNITHCINLIHHFL